MAARWELKSPDAARVQSLVEGLGCTELVATLLANRRILDPEAAAAFLAPRLGQLPDPFAMKGMDVAVARVIRALTGDEVICVWGDYDVDGVTSASQLIWFFRALGCAVRHVVPDRFTEGYGLNAAGIEAVVGDGATLIITVDCGISNAAEVALAHTLGADVIVVDHHQIPPDLPAALAILNPVQEDCAYADKRLAACGVTWVFLIALRSRLREMAWFTDRAEPDLREWLDLTAIGTVADMVPLLGVNRIITHYGLQRVARSERPGVVALRDVSGLLDRPITAGSVGFQLGPRINATGRMAHAAQGVALMTTEDLVEAAQIAGGVDTWNRERREVQAAIFDEAEAMVLAAGDPSERRAIVLAKEGWHAGVLGIVASKMVDRFYRPTIMLTIEDGVAKGSARSISGFKLVHHLHEVSELLDKYGGHDYAAGLTLQADRVADFTRAFDDAARAALAPEQLRRRVRLDAEVPLGWVGHPLIEDTSRLAPFGQGNPEPVYLARDVLVYASRLVGKDKRHVKLSLATGQGAIDGIAFGLHEVAPAPGDHIDIAYVPDVNEYRGRTTLQVRVKALRPAGQEVVTV